MWRALHVDDFKGGRIDGGADAGFAEQSSLNEAVAHEPRSGNAGCLFIPSRAGAGFIGARLLSLEEGNADLSIADGHRPGFITNYGELCIQDERDSVNVTAEIPSKLVESILGFEPPFIRDDSQLERCVPR